MLSKEKLKKVTIRLAEEDIADLRKFYPQGYNKILRGLLRGHLKKLNARMAEILKEKELAGHSGANQGSSGADEHPRSVLQEALGEDDGGFDEDSGGIEGEQEEFQGP